jgi:AcrR family transcriptional regulator
MKTSVEQADLRVRRTHKLLWEALMEELSQHSFEEITVKDICDRAMVHRTTFYKHYEDKYALLEQGMRQMYDDLVVAQEHVPPSAFSVEHPPPYFIHLFEHVAQHQQFYKLMLCGEGVSRFQKLIKEYIAEVASAKMHESAPANQHLAFPLAMHVQCVAGAVLSLLAWWLENDMPLSPHHMAQYLLSISAFVHGEEGGIGCNRAM